MPIKPSPSSSRTKTCASAQVELALAYVNANVAAGRADEAFAVLKQFDEAGALTAALYPPYLDLALKREDVPAAETIANKINVATFTEELALN